MSGLRESSRTSRNIQRNCLEMGSKEEEWRGVGRGGEGEGAERGSREREHNKGRRGRAERRREGGGREGEIMNWKLKSVVPHRRAMGKGPY